MKWMLIVLVFTIAPNGSFIPEVAFHKAYSSDAECNAVGPRFRDIFEIPEDMQTFSMCLPESWFDDNDWTINHYGAQD